ncbi:MAG: S41 family peptidase, partial [bacterium]
MITRHLCILTSGMLCAAVCVSAVGQNVPVNRSQEPVPNIPFPDAVTEGVNSAMQAMLKNGLGVDTNKARRAAIQAVVTTVDPLAWLISADEAMTIVEEGDAASQGIKQKSIALIEKWPGEICYAKFSGLYRGTALETVEALYGATNGSITGMILDLRGAEGKGLDCVESLASLFIGDNREIFSIRNWNGSELNRHRSGECRRLGIPVVFLIDENTAGASELLAAIVKGGFEVLLLGRPTRGDSLIREKIVLPGGEVLYIGT